MPKGTITVVVDGTPVEVQFNPNAPVRTLIPAALKLSGSADRNPNDWQLKFNGQPLNLDTKIEDLHLPPDAVLFLSLLAGVLG